jgi:hypothetical protein
VGGVLAASGASWRALAPGEWGLRAEAGGWGLDIGVAVREGLLRAQAWVLPAGAVAAEALLHRNRRLELVRLATTRAGEVWVMGELVPPLTAGGVERLLGALVAAAEDVRYAARLTDRSR